MARLIDDIRRVGRLTMPWVISPDKQDLWGKHAAVMFQLIRDTHDLPVILIDNVATYYYESSDQEFWDLSVHFPNLAPPFPLFWIEYRIPKRIHSKEAGDTDVTEFMPNGRAGSLIFAMPRECVQGTNIPEHAKWILLYEQFLDYGIRRDEIQGPHGTITMAIDAEGRIIENPFMQTFTAPEHYSVMKKFMGWIHAPLLAISFMHCKNVRVLDNPVPPKLAKKFTARYGFQPAAHKTLVIDPLKEILRTEGRSAESGLARAMHICRGHFRDYRQGAGLFGKYKKLVWTPSVVRGTKGKATPREIEVKAPR